MGKLKGSQTKNLFRGWDFLVVDDVQDNCEILQMILEYMGATVHIAKDGLNAFKVAIKVQPKVILTDLSMPGVDGWQFIDMLQDDPRTSQAKIIALSALNWKDHPEFHERPEFGNYLAKPVSTESLVECIQGLFADEELAAF